MSRNRKLSRPTEHRMAILKTMVTDVLERGRIETTVTRAKEVAPMVEKMITLGKTNTLSSRRLAMNTVKKETIVKNLFETIAPKYESRNGGYTRVIRIGPRRGDGAEMAIIELV